MYKLTLTIATDNDAFEENPLEVAKILEELASYYRDRGFICDRVLRDSNGNRVGEAEIVED